MHCCDEGSQIWQEAESVIHIYLQAVDRDGVWGFRCCDGSAVIGRGGDAAGFIERFCIFLGFPFGMGVLAKEAMEQIVPAF